MIISIFLPPIWILFDISKDKDIALSIILLAILFYYLIRIIIGYRNVQSFLSYSIWEDKLAFISIMFDVPWISDSFMPRENSVVDNGTTLNTNKFHAVVTLLFVIKIFRINILFHIFQRHVLRHIFARRYAKRYGMEYGSIGSVGGIGYKVWSVLLVRTTLLVIIMAIIFPYTRYAFRDDSVSAWLTSVDSTRCVGGEDRLNATLIMQQLEAMRSFYAHGPEKDLRLMDVSADPVTLSGNVDGVREDNVLRFSLRSPGGCGYTLSATMDMTRIRTAQAALDIALYILVLVLVCVYSFVLVEVIDVNVVDPLARMMLLLTHTADKMIRDMKLSTTAVFGAVSDRQLDLMHPDAFETAVCQREYPLFLL